MNRVKKYLSDAVKRGGWRVFVAVALVFGVALLLLPVPGKADAPRESAEPAPAADVAECESRFAAALSKIDGAGRVAVVLTLKSDGYTQFQQDTEFSERTDQSGAQQAESKDTVLVNQGSSTQSPLVIRRGYPEFKGALVVADGASDPNVRLELVSAIASLTGLGADRITVAKMRGGG
ncbi:MAG: stage III sporulation protein AG [Oscillospiraceae bacterium]|jgi:stage III sporulation protein AG|nr:stage III sporulation protein AG [Oscillospiraceae bacterium]